MKYKAWSYNGIAVLERMHTQNMISLKWAEMFTSSGGGLENCTSKWYLLS